MRDATPQGRLISVITERLVVRSDGEGRETTYATLRVVDRGTAMPKEVLARIFHRFYTNKGDKGTRVGMKQVRSFVNAIGGSIHVLSEVARDNRRNAFPSDRLIVKLAEQ